MPPAPAAPFPAYTDFAPRVPVRCVTPGDTGFIHRYYDSSPFSPSGRYFAVTRLPFEDRLPRPGDVAQIVVIDLETGETRTVAETRGWDVQLGAQLQWGADDRTLLYNDVELRDWMPYGVRHDLQTGEVRRLGGTVYSVSPDGRFAASPCLRRMTVTQRGYGVVVPKDQIPENRGASEDDGIWRTDLQTGDARLLISLAQIVEQAGRRVADRAQARRFLRFPRQVESTGHATDARAALAATKPAALEAQASLRRQARGHDECRWQPGARRRLGRTLGQGWPPSQLVPRRRARADEPEHAGRRSALRAARTGRLDLRDAGAGDPGLGSPDLASGRPAPAHGCVRGRTAGLW